MNPTPVSLLEKLRVPDQGQAWRTFVDLYTPLMFHWARRTGLSSSAAADLVQDVFVVLVQKMPTFSYDRDGCFRAWLRTVLTNKWREGLRRRSPQLLDDGASELEPAAADNEADLFAEQEYREHLVGRALKLMQQEFEPTTWRAVWLNVVEGRAAAEVARELNITTEVVYAAKYRVLRRLRKELEGLW